MSTSSLYALFVAFGNTVEYTHQHLAINSSNGILDIFFQVGNITNHFVWSVHQAFDITPKEKI